MCANLLLIENDKHNINFINGIVGNVHKIKIHKTIKDARNGILKNKYDAVIIGKNIPDINILKDDIDIKKKFNYCLDHHNCQSKIHNDFFTFLMDYRSKQLSFLFKKNYYDIIFDNLMHFMNCTNCFRNKKIAINIYPKEDNVLSDEEINLIRKIYAPDADELTVEAYYSGFSGARLFKITGKDPEGNFFKNILKLSKKEKVFRERENYLKYVKNRIELNRCAVLDPCRLGCTEENAAIAYSILESSGEMVNTFENFYLNSENNIQSINNVIGKTFKLFKTWYNSRKLEYENVYYTYHKKFKKIFDTVFDTINNDFPEYNLNSNDIYITPNIVEDVKLYKPKFIYENINKTRCTHIYTSICHGDLNRRNILIDTMGNIWVIDFEYTGIQPCFIDFLQLESEIKFELLHRIPLNDYYFMEKKLIQDKFDVSNLPDTIQNESIKRAFYSIKKIRSFAKNIKEDNFIEYLYGLLTYSFFYLYLKPLDRNDLWRKKHSLISLSLIFEEIQNPNIHI